MKHYDEKSLPDLETSFLLKEYIAIQSLRLVDAEDYGAEEEYAACLAAEIDRRFPLPARL